MPVLLLFTLVGAVIAAGGWWAIRSVFRRTAHAPDPDELVVVAGPGSELEIEVLRSKQNALGIDAFTRDRIGRVIDGWPPNFAGWEVLARYRDYDRAREIIGSPAPENETPET